MENTYDRYLVLDAPGNNAESPPDSYTVQIVISWPFRPGFMGSDSAQDFPPTNAACVELIKAFARTWADPLRSLVLTIPDDAEVQQLLLYDWAPPKDLKSTEQTVLFGDAFHPMTMCQYTLSAP